MIKILKILGLAMALSALLVVSITSTVFAAGPNTDNGAQIQTQNQGEECICGECPCDECPCGECVCGECEPNKYQHNWNWSEQDEPCGPHGPYKYQRGKID